MNRFGVDSFIVSTATIARNAIGGHGRSRGDPRFGSPNYRFRLRLPLRMHALRARSEAHPFDLTNAFTAPSARVHVYRIGPNERNSRGSAGPGSEGLLICQAVTVPRAAAASHLACCGQVFAKGPGRGSPSFEPPSTLRLAKLLNLEPVVS